MRILMPSIVDPAVQLGGAWTMTRGLLRLLRDGPLAAEVEVVAARRGSHVGHVLRQATALGTSLITALPAKVEFNRSRRLLSEVERLLGQRRFDLVVLNGADLLWLLPHLPGWMSCVLVAHNLEHELFAAQLRWWSALPSWATRLLRRDCERLRRYEEDGFRRVGQVIFLSATNEARARATWPELRTLILPPVFDGPPAVRPVRAPGDHIVDVGMLANFNWWPNRQGFDWFLRRVFPHVSSSIRVHLFGHGSIALAPRHPGIIAHGYVDRLEADVWGVCDFVICPILSGSGVSIKTAEAIYRGVPVLATPFAARGLPLESHPSIVLLDGAEAWIRFLNNNASMLARQAVPMDLSNRFRGSAHETAVADFLTAALA